MNCEEFQEKWVDSLESNLSPDSRKEWEAHRKSCSVCQSEVQSLEELSHELKGLPPVSPLPPVFWNRQTESILRRIDRLPRRRWARFWEGLFRPRTAFAAAMMVLLLFFGYRYLPHTHVPISTELDVGDLAFSEMQDQGSILSLNEDQLDRYYAYTVEKYFPKTDVEEEGSEEGVWVDDLNEQQLNRAIQYFQNQEGRRAL